MANTEVKEKMNKGIESFKNDLATIRAGRANPRILDNVTVDYYGVPTPLNQVGNVSVPEARIIQIQPWEGSMLKEIEKAVNKADLGINPTNDGTVIRLVFPELTEERRVSLTKDIKKKGETTKVVIRNIRRDGMDTLKKMEKANELTEDDLAKLETELQKITDSNVEIIDKLVADKNKEVLSI